MTPILRHSFHQNKQGVFALKVLIVNPIIYTSETENIKKVPSVKDTMIYDLCLAFHKKGIEVTLAAAEDYKPLEEEEYPFRIEWFKCVCKKIFKPNVLPFCPDIAKLAQAEHFDLIISSEVFSVNSLLLARKAPKRLIIWHELAKHNKIFKEIPSRLWYGIIAKHFFKNVLIVPRSAEAKVFISGYCKNVCETVIDHGVNLEKFESKTVKDNYFIVSSQLIARKRINLIIEKFADYLKEYDSSCLLYIMGEGEERSALEEQVRRLKIEENVRFFGKLPHGELKKYLARARAMLVYTEKDNNMVSIVEALACTTPVITTPVPYNASYIRLNDLGIVDAFWGAKEMHSVVKNAEFYIGKCLNYRSFISTDSKASTFLELAKRLETE